MFWKQVRKLREHQTVDPMSNIVQKNEIDFILDQGIYDEIHIQHNLHYGVEFRDRISNNFRRIIGINANIPSFLEIDVLSPYISNKGPPERASLSLSDSVETVGWLQAELALQKDQFAALSYVVENTDYQTVVILRIKLKNIIERAARNLPVENIEVKRRRILKNPHDLDFELQKMIEF